MTTKLLRDLIFEEIDKIVCPENFIYYHTKFWEFATNETFDQRFGENDRDPFIDFLFEPYYHLVNLLKVYGNQVQKIASSPGSITAVRFITKRLDADRKKINTVFNEQNLIKSIDKHNSTTVEKVIRIEYLKDYLTKIEALRKQIEEEWSLLINTIDTYKLTEGIPVIVIGNKVAPFTEFYDLVRDLKGQYREAVGKANASGRSFSVEGLHKRNLPAILNYLKRNKFLSSEEDLENFERMFSGDTFQKIRKLNWVGSISSLKHFISLAYKSGFIIGPNNKWHITPNWFLVKGDPLRNKQLSENVNKSGTSKEAKYALNKLFESIKSGTPL